MNTKIEVNTIIYFFYFAVSSEGFLSNCHFLISDDLRKVSGASDHLYFNEQRIKEHGGIVAYPVA